MRFEIPFNEKISREQSIVYFESLWKKTLQKNKKLWYHILIYIPLGILVIYGNGNVGYLFVAAGLFFLFAYFNVRNQYLRKRKEYLNLVEDHIKNYSSSEKHCIWEFLEDVFHYSDYKYDLKINWIAFTKFNVQEKNLLIELRSNVVANFFLNEDEVGAENFEKIIAFLETKIKKDGTL